MGSRAPVLFGKYQLLERLAQGGMAEVFKAKSHGVEGFEKVLVIKRILPELGDNPDFVEMFINEAKIAVTLSHANIVQVFDLGRADDSYFIAMEYVAGYDLATVLRLGKAHHDPLPTELAVYVVSEIAKGLDYAHRRRDSRMQPLHIVHRDVSPQNVLLSNEGEVKLTDFGIAKAKTTVDRRREGEVSDDDLSVKGKYAYMAPEQARGEPVDGRADLFALGSVLYETLAGVNPFQSPSPYETLKAVQAGNHRALADAAPQLPEELCSIVDRAMCAGATGRQDNAGQLYEELIQFLYSSGRRVGAHDLSRYLDRLRQAAQADAEADGGRDSEVPFERAFAPDSPQAGFDTTPVEVPTSTTSLPPPMIPASATGTPHSGLVRLSEQRDVTALALAAEGEVPMPESTIRALIRRFGGMVVSEPNRPQARPLVAYFGLRYPDGHDTEAAARCALRAERATRATSTEGAWVTLKAAIHPGRVLIDMEGELIRDHRSNDLIAEVAELLELASPAMVIASKSARRTLRAGFRLMTPHADGNLPESGQAILDSGAYAVMEERKGAETAGRFVGRREDLRRVGELLADANHGESRIIAVVGEAGTGKSRLLNETMRRLRLGGHDVGIHVANIPRHSRDVPLAAVQEMLRVVLGIDEFDPDPIARDKVGRLRELGLTAPEMGAVEVLLGQRVEAPEGPAGDRALRAAFGRIATRLAEDRLTVFVFDGVEAMDDESQSLLASLLGSAQQSRVAILLAYRPGFVHGWSDFPGYHEISLGPLLDEEVARLTAARLGSENVPSDLLHGVTVKSAGNPLYVEEYLKALVDAGAVRLISGEIEFRPEIAQVEVPKTLRGIVASRVDRLSARERHLLQVAAVAGSKFTASLLAKVSGEDAAAVSKALAVLQKRGLLVRKAPGEYGFHHDLLWEVLREGLPLEARTELHGAVARALEEMHAPRLDELAEQLAHHYRQAGDRVRAVAYLERAADRLENESSPEGAVTNLVRALRMLSQEATPDRERILEVYARIGHLSLTCRDYAAGDKRMAAALELAEELERDDWIARFAMLRGRILVNANQFVEGRHWLARAREEAESVADHRLLRDILLATAEADGRNGEYLSATKLLREVLSISREPGDVTAQIRCLIPLAIAYAAIGDPTSAMETLEEARDLAALGGNRFTDAELYKTEALVHYYGRDIEASIEASARALEIAKEHGFHYEATANAHNMGEAYLRLGDYRRAFAALRYSYEMAQQHGFAKLEMTNLRVLGFIDATKFASEEGRQRIKESVKFAADHGYVWDLIQGKYMLAHADHTLGRVDDARRGFREVLRLAADNGNRRIEEDTEEALRALQAGDALPLPG